jgi:hypothetical protein
MLVCLSLDKINRTQKLTISIYTNKYRPGMCPYETILRHAMRHVDKLHPRNRCITWRSKKGSSRIASNPVADSTVHSVDNRHWQESIAKVGYDVVSPPARDFYRSFKNSEVQ